MFLPIDLDFPNLYYCNTINQQIFITCLFIISKYGFLFIICP